MNKNRLKQLLKAIENLNVELFEVQECVNQLCEFSNQLEDELRYDIKKEESK